MGVKSIVIFAKDGNDMPCPFKVGDTVHTSPIPEDFRLPMWIMFGKRIEESVVVDEHPVCPEGNPAFWSAKWFSPVSDIDEKEMKREYNLNKIIV